MGIFTPSGHNGENKVIQTRNGFSMRIGEIIESRLNGLCGGFATSPIICEKSDEERGARARPD
jgi:hypothetical protein